MDFFSLFYHTIANRLFCFFESVSTDILKLTVLTSKSNLKILILIATLKMRSSDVQDIFNGRK